MAVYSSKHLSEIKNEFERGVFLVVYNSRKQRYSRIVASVVLVMKHVLRGLLFSWPLYLLALAAYSIGLVMFEVINTFSARLELRHQHIGLLLMTGMG